MDVTRGGDPTGRHRFAVLAGIAVLVGGTLMVSPPEHTLFWNTWFDAGHVPMSGALALLFRHLLARRGEPGASLLAIGTVLLIGIGTELVQALQPGREPSVADLVNDAAGAGAFLLLRAVWSGERRRDPTPWHRRHRLATAVAAVVLVIAALAAPAHVFAAYAARTAALPVLFPLDGRWWETYFVKPQQALLTPAAFTPGGPGADRRRYARLDLYPADYSGLTLEEPVGDWRPYRRLVFELYSDLGNPIAVNVRIHDRAHVNRFDDRYNTRIVVRPGFTRVAIDLDAVRDAPTSRSMDMGAIRGIVIFSAGLREPTHLFVGPIRLE